ncbi:MAG: C2 family cysteine protease [Myxococcota bacterium]
MIRSLRASAASMLFVLAFTACGEEDLQNELLRPSLTMIRTGEVEPDAPPVVPEDHYLPGIQIQSEDYDFDDTGRTMPPPFEGIPSDLSRMLALDDPATLEKHSSYGYAPGTGRLYDGASAEDTLNYDDIEQGSIGDCYLVAALSAAAYADADGSVRDGMIREQLDADGYVTHFAVRFYDGWGTPQDVLVDADLVRKNDKPIYARSADTDSDGEEWAVSLFEKAYAQWHGGYDTIGDGGWAGDVMQAITGSTANYRSVARMSDATVLRSIEDAVDDNRPVVAGTFGEEDGVDYSGTKIYAWHAYTVLGVKRPEGEDPMVTLRNPWGEVEPAGNGPDDGIFDLPMPEFRRLYQGVTFGGSARNDTTAPSSVDDLAAIGVVEGKASLSFTATGDDQGKGLAHAYDVRISDAPITNANFYDALKLASGSPQAPGTRETVEALLPESERTYYIAVRVADEAGNLSALSNVLEIETADAPIDGVEPTLFDFEGGDQGWEATGLFHRTDLDAVSGTYSYWMGQASSLDYDTGERVQSALTSPILDLRDSSTVVVMWEQLLDVEAGASRDLAVLEVSTQRGGFNDWATVWEKDSTNDTFNLFSAELDAFAGEQVQLRFRFDSVDAQSNAGLGWFIDDIWVWADK